MTDENKAAREGRSPADGEVGEVNIGAKPESTIKRASASELAESGYYGVGDLPGKPMPGENKSATPATENKAGSTTEDGHLDGVNFASGAAAELAESEGLTKSDLKGKGSGADGGFTKADVEEIVASKAK